MTAYINLIKSLLNCPNGEELSLLQANAELVDQEFVQVMKSVAAQMAEAGNENSAKWLLALAAELAEILGISSTSPPAPLLQGEGRNTPPLPSSKGELGGLGYTSVTLQDYLNFLISVLQIVEDDNRPQSIYPLLQNNLNKLDDKLAHILTVWAKETLAKLEPEVAESLAEAILSFSNLMGQFTLGNIASNKEIAIAGYQAVVPIFSQSDFPKDWVMTQNNLANAYCDRIRGNRADNLEKAITHYHNALRFLSQSDFRQDWAATQNNLAAAYFDRIRGDRAENLEKAITHYHNALLVRTQSDFPQYWAMTQNNLAATYSQRIGGDRAENLEAAIAHCHNALLVCTQSDSPQQWANTQNNLAIAYCKRIHGDRAENLEAAIAHFNNTLLVYTQSDFPQYWATKTNLGNAYSDRIRGDRAENLEAAIAHYDNALLVCTQSDFPQQWAMTQNNLGNAYSYRIGGDRAENLEAAIAHYHNALLVYTPNRFPIECFQTSQNLGNLAWNTQDFKLAIQSYQLAIQAVEQSRNWVIDEERRQEILTESIYVYERIIQAYLNIGEIGKALESTERFRCQRLVELMASDVLNPGGEITPEVQALLIDYEELQQQINSLRFNSQTEATPALTKSRRLPDEQVLAAIQSEIQKLEEQKQQVWKQLRRYDPVLAGQIQVEHLKLNQIQELIENDTTALLSLYTTGDDTHIFILLKDQSPQVYTCKGQGIETFQNWIAKNWFDSYIGANAEWRENIETFLQELAQRLQLKDLISQYLIGIEELIIVPHLRLHQMPFAALPIDGIETFPRKGARRQ
ncbi:tetratricopeptide repeat protein [Coleofasciculus sp. E2-BRE-01]|uniref:tetratricopeptide repeat protein n=1 Tax=Coleofasciculus sp. E2-BRE-01 TaxID=3069524 RepID=UPI0032F5E04A